MIHWYRIAISGNVHSLLLYSRKWPLLHHVLAIPQAGTRMSSWARPRPIFLICRAANEIYSKCEYPRHDKQIVKLGCTLGNPVCDARLHQARSPRSTVQAAAATMNRHCLKWNRSFSQVALRSCTAEVPLYECQPMPKRMSATLTQVDSSLESESNRCLDSRCRIEPEVDRLPD